MHQWNTFILIAVALPLVVALVNYLLPFSILRKTSVILTAIVLAASAAWLHLNVGNDPVQLSYPGFDRVIMAADLAILLYIAWVALQRRHLLLGILAALQLAAVWYVEIMAHPVTSRVSSLLIDRLAVVLYLLVAIVGSIICIYALKYMEDHEEHGRKGRNGRFFLWLVAFLGVMNGLIFANNLFWLYFFWEGTTLCSFLLIGHNDDEEARANALHALLLNSLGGLALIGGIMLLVLKYGGDGVSLAKLVNGGLGPAGVTIVAALALLAFGAFTKSAQFPFQSWLLGAMVAPTPVSALLHSSTMVKAGVYLVLRLAPAYKGLLLSPVIALFGVFTFFAASLMAVGDDNGKRVLAYSTVANLGLIIACCGLNTPLAISAAILLIMFHAVSKAMLFMGVGVIEHILGSRVIENMEGLAARVPGLALIMGIGIFTMFLPPFGMLFGKWAAMESALRQPLMLFLFVAASALTAVFWTKWLGRLLSTLPGEEAISKPQTISGYYQFSLWLPAAGAIIMSLGLGAIFKYLVAPAQSAWYPVNLIAAPGLTMINGRLGVSLGAFPTVLLFTGILITLILFLIFFRPQRHQLGQVYMGGANTGEAFSGSFTGIMDSSSQVALGGYYFNRVINARLTRWLNIAAVLILLIMLGVVVI